MKKLLLLFFMFFSLTSCTEELENNLINVDTWKWSNSKTIYGTEIEVVEVKEISFRNNTLVDLVISNEEDTLLYHKTNIVWKTIFLNSLEIIEEDNTYETVVKVNEYSIINLYLSGFSDNNKVYEFFPKRSI